MTKIKSEIKEREIEMSSDTLDQIQRDIHMQEYKLMDACIEGITQYASQLKSRTDGIIKIKELRNLIDEIIGYWGLDAMNDTIAHHKYLIPFDTIVEKGGNKKIIIKDDLKIITLLGLYYHGMKIASYQSEDDKELIRYVRDLIVEISAYWEYNSELIDEFSRGLTQVLMKNL